MLRNYIKTAFRNLWRNKVFSAINILGLAVGMACCILISLFISDELSYDRQNKDADRIYRVVQNLVNDDGSITPVATTPPGLAIALQKEIPEIAQVTRLFPRGWDNNYYVRSGENRFLEENICRADSSIFNVFTIPFVSGNPKTAMANPQSIILTESMAKKYFGATDPIGKVIQVDDWQPRIVTGVIRDIPDNTHFKIDFLVTLASDPMGEEDNNWNWNSFYTYIKLKPGSDIKAVNKEIRAIFKTNQSKSHSYVYCQPLTSIHLSSHLQSELRPNSDKSYIYIFGIIAIFILLIAGVNYINLTTAQSTLRAKEIGIRKVSGALKTALVGQFLTEAVIFSLIAAITATGLALLLLPAVNTITGKELRLVADGNYSIIGVIPGFALLVGLLAGIYPAVYLSSLRPVRALKGEKGPGRQHFSLRKILVIVQFTISITLILGTIVIVDQMDFIRQADLGLDKNHLITVNDIYYLNNTQRTALKEKLLEIPGVRKVAASDGMPGGEIWTRSVRLSGTRHDVLINSLSVDEDFLDALSIKLKDGRNFRPASREDSRLEVILNETAVRDLAIPTPVTGQRLVWSQDPHTGTSTYANIVGVVKDFHFTSLRSEIKPFAFAYNRKRQWKYAIKIDGSNIARTLAGIKNVWDAQVNSRPFQYTFLDETYGRLYYSELNFKKIFSDITFIAIFISCLGLFALSSFAAEQRRKEIGIRKVLGASVQSIVSMISKDFLKLILIAAAISFPLGGWLMSSWLKDFAYRINIGFWIYAASGLLALIIAFATILFHTLKAAEANPVSSLKSE